MSASMCPVGPNQAQRTDTLAKRQESTDRDVCRGVGTRRDVSQRPRTKQPANEDFEDLPHVNSLYQTVTTTGSGSFSILFVVVIA